MLNNLPPTLKELLLHRKQPDGSILPCLFVLEKVTNTILSESCGTNMVQEAEANLTTWRTKNSGDNMGAYLQSDSDAMVLLLDILNSDKPSEIPGADAWRAHLQAELDKLPPNCTTCDRNSVLRRVARGLQSQVAALLVEHPEYRLQKQGSPQSS